MAGPLYIADNESAVMTVALDGLSVLFHAPSGMTHIVAPPAPEILAALQDGPADLEEILRRLEATFDFEPSPLMGEGLGGGGVNEAQCVSGCATPPHEQVRIAPRSEAMPGGHGDLFILPIEGRGFLAEALHARLDELEAAGLVRRA